MNMSDGTTTAISFRRKKRANTGSIRRRQELLDRSAGYKTTCNTRASDKAKFYEVSESLRKFGDHGFDAAQTSAILLQASNRSTQACRRFSLLRRPRHPPDAMRSTALQTSWKRAKRRTL